MQTNIPGRVPIELPASYPEFAWYYPNCEMETKAWFVSNAQPNWVYFDCGANIGYYSILFAQLSPAGTVIAVEPTSTADLLSVNLAHHKLENVRIQRVALSDSSGRKVEDIHRLWGSTAERKTYNFSTVDQLVHEQRLTCVNCIKIDVDSYDFEVLRGAEQTLARFDPWVVIELSESLTLRNTSRNEVFTWLQERGYTSAALLDRENYLLKRSPGSDQAQIPLDILRWAAGHGLVEGLKRGVGRPGKGFQWTRPDYAADALTESSTDTAWVDFFQQSFSANTTSPVWQLFQYACMTRYFEPDLVIELGGWNGDTTRALAIGLMGNRSTTARLISFHTTPDTASVLNSLKPSAGTHQLALPEIETHSRAVSNADVDVITNKSQRVIVFANDPAQETTRVLLEKILPKIASRPHFVVVGGISDGNYGVPPSYSERPGIYAFHETHSSRSDLPAILDFTSRNQISLFSADRSFHASLGSDPQRMTQLSSALGSLFALQSHWRWFSLDERPGFPHLFPSSP